MLRKSTIALSLSVSALSGKQINLVEYGKETFHALGCAECHSEAKSDNAFKTGPRLYGLFQSTPRDRDIIEAGENHRHTIKANQAYYNDSIRKPLAELAIAEEGPTKGEAFLPIMPAYPEELLTEQKALAIFHYLRTLNDGDAKGPAKVMAEIDDSQKIKDIHNDPTEILVTDRTRIYRARLAGASARAVVVGLPSGLNYVFDPRTLSFTKMWWGGYINIRPEINGRGKGPSTPGHQAKEIKLTQPIGSPTAIDLSFKSPLHNDGNTIGANLHGDVEFDEQLKDADARFLGFKYSDKKDGNPTFFYQIGKDNYSAKLELNPDGKGTITMGKTSDVKSRSFGGDAYKAPENLWRPRKIPTLGPQKVATTPMPGIHLIPGYSAERIPAPTDPHGRPQLFEPMGMDTAEDGAIIVTTRSAGAWKYQNNTWTMIHDGLLDSLGVIIEKDHLIVGQKPELTRLDDKDGDGFYESSRTLSEDFLITTNYHEYLHGPAKGKDGNYYFALNLGEHGGKHIYKANGNWMGSQGGLRGWTLQVTPDGKTSRFAYGLRSPAGVGTGPDGLIYYTENQGEYNGTSKLHIIRKDRYYGHPSSLVDMKGLKPNSPGIHWEKHKDKAEPAVALIPHGRLSNSPGSPAWDLTGGKFGPFKGDMYVGDQTLSTLFRIKPKEGHEAALIPFGQGFPSGILRPNFGKDGALYIGQTGRGWRSRGGSLAALVKLTYKKDDSPKLADVTRKDNKFTLHFTTRLKTRNADFKVLSWSYHDKPGYGSPENNRQDEKVSNTEFSSDGKSVTVTIAENPKREAGSRVYMFNSNQLPHNKKGTLEAFYTISK